LLGAESILAIHVHQSMPDNRTSCEIKNEHHKNILILAIDENVLIPAAGMLPSVGHRTRGTVVLLKIR